MNRFRRLHNDDCLPLLLPLTVLNLVSWLISREELVILFSLENKIETIKVDQKSNSRFQEGLLQKDEIKRN